MQMRMTAAIFPRIPSRNPFTGGYPPGAAGGWACRCATASRSLATTGRSVPSPVILKIFSIVGWVVITTIAPRRS